MREFKLPEEIQEIKETVPTDMIIISVPKTGKSTILAELTKQKNAIIFNLEKGGTDYLSGRYINIYDDSITSFDEAMEIYKGYRNELLKHKGKYDILCIDSLTALDEMSNLMGTYYYMYSVPQGKNFNRDPKNPSVIYPYGDERFKMVTELGDGYGYAHTRKWFLDQLGIFNEIAPYRLYTGHVKDIMAKGNNNIEEVQGKEINITGKLKGIVARKISTLAKLIVDGDKRYLSFEVNNDAILAGSRVPHLQGQILISEKDKEGKIITYWDKIYK